MKTSPLAALRKDRQPSKSARVARAGLLTALAVASAICLAFVLWRSASAQTAFNLQTVAGSSGGAGLVAEFQNARGLAAASASIIYVADTDNHVVRKVDVSANSITIVAGRLGMPATDSTAANGDGGPAANALLNGPSDVALDDAGNLYIADSGNHRIRKVSAGGNTISTVAGNGTPGSGSGPATGAVLFDPRGLSFDAAGGLFIADTGNHRVVSVTGVMTESATVSNVAGNGGAGSEGDGGPATIAGLTSPGDVAIDGSIIYIADTGNHKIRVIDALGVINTFAGTGAAGFGSDSGAPGSIQLSSPAGVAVDASHTVFISDTGNHRLRQSDASLLTTIAGRAGQGYNGDGAPATAFTLNGPAGVAVISSQVFFMDAGNRRLRKVAGTTLSTVASDGSSGFGGDGGLAVNAKLDGPMGVAVDAAGNYYIADTNNHVVRKVNASDGKVNTIAGTPGVASSGPTDPNGDGGPAASATFNRPSALAVDGSFSVYVADTGNHRIRKITLDGNISTIAGTVGAGTPTLNGPSGVAVDGTTVYIADPGNHVIRSVTTTGGTVTIFAGTAGSLGFSGDTGLATIARLNRPSGVAVGGNGDVFIADTNNHRIRKVSGVTITSVVGTGVPRSGFEGDGGSAATARLNSPAAVAPDSAGNLYIVDKGNNRIRRVNASDNKINTVIGNGLVGFSGDGGPATQAALSLANSVAIGSPGVFVADTGNNRIRLAVAPPNSAPSLTSPGNKTVDEGQTLAFTLQATDPNAGQTLTYSMSGAPSGATLNSTTGAFSYSPGFDVVPNNAGATQAFTVTFTATDNAAPPLADSKPITITVNNVNRPPVVDSGAIPATLEATGPAGAPLQLNGAATDPDGDQIASVIWTDTRPGQSPQTIANQLSQSVTLALGQHSIVLTASDGKPNGTVSTAAKNVTVQDTTQPVFSNLPADITQTITSGAGANVTFNLPTATDAVSGNRPVTANPASASFFPTGMTTVTFTAADAAGNPGTATFKVTVVCNGTGCSGGGAMNFNLAAFAGSGLFGSSGDGNAAINAAFKQPHGVAAGATGDVFISDAEARVIRRVNAQGLISAFAGTGAKGFAGDGGAASSARFNHPTGLAFDGPRNALFVADANNHRVRRIDLANNTITTIAGNGVAALGASGAATSTSLNHPMGAAVDASGAVYIADTGNNRVCKVVNGQLTVVAGTGEVGGSGDGGSATAAKLNHPTGVAVSSDGANVFVADTGNNRARKISGGTINAFAGTGASGFGGDGGAAAAATLNAPTDVMLDSSGNLFITDSDNERIRKVSASDAKINTVAGNGNAGNTGDGGAATSATLDTPRGVARDSNGVVYFADAGNLRARKLTMTGPQNNPPVPALVANQSLNKNQVLDVALSATDADNDPVTFSVVPALGFVSIINANPANRTATMRINPAGGNAGVYNVQVQAADDKGGTGLTPAFTITVTDPNAPQNRPPVAVANTLPSSVVAQNGSTAMVALDGTGSSDPDGDPLTFSWTDNGQVIATTATADVPLAIGQHSIVLTVSDGRGGTSSTAPQAVNVTAPSNELAINTVSPASARRGQTVMVTVTGTGFVSNSILTVNGGGVTVTITSFTSTEINAKFAISSNTSATVRGITVTNPGVASVTKSSAFSILP